MLLIGEVVAGGHGGDQGFVEQRLEDDVVGGRWRVADQSRVDAPFTGGVDVVQPLGISASSSRASG